MALEVARRTGDVNLACRMRIFAMRAAARSSLFEDGIAVGEAALRDPDLTDAWRARLAAWLAVLLLLSGQAQRGEGRAFDALRYAAMTGDPLATASAHQAAAFSSGTAEAVAHSGAALAALGSDAESADLRLLLLRNRLGWLVRLDDDEELERTLAAALEEADRTGTFAAVGIRGAAAHVRYRQGRWDDALAQLDRIEPEFREHGHAVRLRALTALIALHRGNLADAEAALRTAGTAVQRPPDSMEPGGSHLLVARALIGEGQGDLDLAIGVMTGWLAIPATLRRHLDFDDAPDLVRLALAAGQPELAGTVVKRLEEDAAADPVTGRILAARSSRAQLDGDAAALARAAADYRQRGWPMRRGLALEEAAVRLAQAGQQAEARAALTEATGTYAGIGASWDVRRAEARLRQHGVRRGPHSAHRTEATGWTALTPAEAQVALLAADGLSNADIATRLFVSPRTVETHVSQVLAKLQIRSRAELARAYAEQADHWRHGR
jgi:DNA-binding CsgD family transcriptional regulator